MFAKVPPIGCQVDKILIFNFLGCAWPGRSFDIDTAGVRVRVVTTYILNKDRMMLVAKKKPHNKMIIILLWGHVARSGFEPETSGL